MLQDQGRLEPESRPPVPIPQIDLGQCILKNENINPAIVLWKGTHFSVLSCALPIPGGFKWIPLESTGIHWNI